jgi:hypothetical protein
MFPAMASWMRIVVAPALLLSGSAAGVARLGAQTVSLEQYSTPLIPKPDTVRDGARVRVWERLRGESAVDLIGIVRFLGVDSLRLQPPGTIPVVAIPVARISHVQVSGGPRSGPRWRSLLIGAGIGALAGGIAGAVAGDASHRNTAKFTFVGLGGGLAAGAVIGWLVPGEAWREAALPSAAQRDSVAHGG